jgi:hypothetical protein
MNETFIRGATRSSGFSVGILALTALFVAGDASVNAQQWQPLANQPGEVASATCSQDGITLYAVLVGENLPFPSLRPRQFFAA